MDSMSSRPHVDRALCTQCGLCVEVCPCHAVTMEEEGPVFHCGKLHDGDSACPRGGSCWHICEEICFARAIDCPFEIVPGESECDV